MIYVKYKNDEIYYETLFKRINDNVVSVNNRKGVNPCGFETFNTEGVKLGNFSDYTTVCRVTDNAVWYSNDGSVYVEPQPSEPRELTKDEIKQELTDAVQVYLDAKASERGYDGILSVCSYIDTGVEKFDIEGAQARRWRSAVWAFCYAYLDDVLAGKKAIPTSSELIEQLPKIQW